MLKLNSEILLTLIILSATNLFAQDWKCIIYGDTRNDRTEHREVLESIVKNTPDYQFIINVGDVVDHGDVESEWEDWRNTVTDVLGSTGQENVPPKYMATPGNHDATETSDGLKNWMQYLPAQNKLYCTDDINESDGKYFTFDHENVRFIILDSDKSDEEGEQYDMLINALSNNIKEWIIVIWHDPIFSFGEKSYEEKFHTLWGTKIYEFGGDIIFIGDAHYYVRTKKMMLNGEKHPPIDSLNGVTHIVTGNGGAPIDVPNPNYDDNGYMVAKAASDNSHYGYTELYFKNDSLYLTHFLRDGSVLDNEIFTPNEKTKISNVNSIKNVNQTQLLQSYPNPFNLSTNITFQLEKESNISIKIYDLNGREIRTLINNQNFTAGIHKVSWNGTNENNQIIANGVYYYKLESDHYSHSLKTILLK